jgi:hypothetical protein
MEMGLVVLSKAEVVEATVRSLDLDAEILDLDSPEGLAAALRRTASFRCPITARSLVNTAAATLEGLTSVADLKVKLSELLQAMISIGDFIELSPTEQLQSAGKLIYLAPPTFVRTLGGAYFILGVRPEGAPFLDNALMPLVEYERHTRRILDQDPPGIGALLEQNGLREIDQARWLHCPPEEPYESGAAPLKGRHAAMGMVLSA